MKLTLPWVALGFAIGVLWLWITALWMFQVQYMLRILTACWER